MDVGSVDIHVDDTTTVYADPADIDPAGNWGAHYDYGDDHYEEADHYDDRFHEASREYNEQHQQYSDPQVGAPMVDGHIVDGDTSENPLAVSPTHTVKPRPPPLSMATVDPRDCEKKEIALTNAIIRCPWVILLSGAFSMLIFFFLIIQVLGFAINTQSDGNRARNDIRTERVDANKEVVSLTKDRVEDALGLAPGITVALGERSEAEILFDFIFIANKDDNVLAPESLKLMADMEQVLLGHSEYKDYCALRDSNVTTGPPYEICQAPYSYPKLMDAAKRLRSIPAFEATCGTSRDSMVLRGCAAILQLAAAGLGWVPTTGFSPGCTAAFPPLSATNSLACVMNCSFIPECKAYTFNSGSCMYYTCDTQGGADPASTYFSKEWADRQVSFASQAEVDLLSKLLWNAFRVNKGYLFGFLGKEFDPDQNALKSKVLHTTVYYGLPRKPYKNFDDDGERQKQEDEFVTFARGADFLGSLANIDTNEYWDAVYFAGTLSSSALIDVLIRDALLALGSVLFVYFYIQIHTGSWFVATFGMIQVLMPFPLAYLVYRGVFQVKAFFALSTLSLYIVLAIGADDIFVFVDAWEQARFCPDPEVSYLKGRLAWAWKRAATAMLITSVTTMAAFLATMTSPLLSTSTFGLFAALLVFWDYVLVITYFPAAVVLYHRRYEGQSGCCCCMKPIEGFLKTPEDVATGLASPIKPDRTGAGSPVGGAMTEEAMKGRRKSALCIIIVGVVFYFIGFLLLAVAPFSRPTLLGGLLLLIVGLAVWMVGMNRLPRNPNAESGLQAFMGGTVADFVTSKKRYATIAFLAVFAVGMIACATQLQPSTKSDQFLPRWHPFQRFLDALLNDFKFSDRDEVPQVTVAWGLQTDGPIDRSGISAYDTDKKGKPVYSTTTPNFAAPESQTFMLALCDKAETHTETRNGKELRIVRPLLPDGQDTMCPMRGFKAWLEAQGRTFPASAADFPNLVFQFHNASIDRDPDSRKSAVPSERYSDALFFEGTTLKWVRLVFNTTLKDEFGTPFADLRDLHDTWDAFINKENDNTTPLKGLAMHSSEAWVRMHTQRTYVNGAITGILTSSGLAFVVILLATQNLLVAFLSLLEIGGIVSCVLGLIWLFGWELGTIESVTLTILVGLSVDYVVHLAHAYVSSHSEKRADRVRDALREMGGTVLGGAATSMGASFLLFATYLQFFFKFGVFMCLTILLSWLWAMGFFLPMLATIGPEGNFCSFKPFLQKCVKKKQ